MIVPGITLNKHIDAPPDKVFAQATDMAGWAGRIKAIVRVEVLTDGPTRAGTRFRETRIVFKREATEEMEFTAFDPPRMYALGCENHGCRYKFTFNFTPNASGTDVEMRFEAQALTWIAKLMSVMMAPMMKMMVKECAKDLDDLKAAAEAAA